MGCAAKEPGFKGAPTTWSTSDMLKLRFWKCPGGEEKPEAEFHEGVPGSHIRPRVLATETVVNAHSEAAC